MLWILERDAVKVIRFGLVEKLYQATGNRLCDLFPVGFFFHSRGFADVGKETAFDKNCRSMCVERYLESLVLDTAIIGSSGLTDLVLNRLS